MRRYAFLSFLLSTLAAFPASAQFIAVWQVSEMQPDIEYGGRADSIAVHPANDDILIVSTESGGLFRTADRGVTWTHIDSFPTFWTRRGTVTYLPANPNVVLATANADFKTTNGGGIYRSPDGGVTWNQIPSPPAPPNSSAIFEAREISIAPDTGTIYVATSYGVAISPDEGLTWTHTDPFGTGEFVSSVLALEGGIVIAGGANGMRRSINSGAVWGAVSASGNSRFGEGNTHAFSRSPYWPEQAYMVNNANEFFYTVDGGDTWTKIPTAPARSSCGGIGFVKARIPAGGPGSPRCLSLWRGDRCGLHRLNAPEVSARVFDYSGTWASSMVDHDDTRDLAFDSVGRPALLAADGGVHTSSNDGASWTLTGGGRDGFHALQLTEVKGQMVWDRSRHDLYFGTQDNALWASGDAGQTWINPILWEGFHIEAEPRVPREIDSKVTLVNCGTCVQTMTDALFFNPTRWSNAQTPSAGDPKILRRSLHAQGVKADNSFAKGFAVSTDLGLTWQQHATFNEDRLSMPRLVRPGGRLFVLYQAIRTGMSTSGVQIDHLARITGSGLASPPAVRYPSMTNFGGLGVIPTVFAWYEVFDADPANSRHLIAPDVINQKMMETFDAGNNWTEIPALTSLVTDGGRYRFGRFKPNDGVVHSNASTVNFNRDDPNLVAVGTMEGGILLSEDRGATWDRVGGSERITFITSIEWKSATEAIVSSYGRGLWRLKRRILISLPAEPPYCEGLCAYIPFDPPATGVPFTIILVFNGQIQGVSATNGAVQTVYVTPASSVVIFTDSGTSNITITESSEAVGWTGVKPPETPNGQLLVGVTLNKNDAPINVVVAKEPLALYAPTETEQNQDEEPIGEETSPTAGRPYLSLNLSNANMVFPSTPMQISGRDFPPSTTITITIDGNTAANVEASDKGTISLTVNAPATLGLHTVKALDAAKKLLDGASFLVTHRDGDEE